MQALYHLWGGVARGATRGLQQLSFLVCVRQSEVHDLETGIEVQEQVLGFEIPVYYTEFVDILNAGYKLLEQLTSLFLGEPTLASVLPLLIDNIVKQLAVLDVLHNQKQVLGRLDDLVELDDVGVPYELQDVDLPGHPLDIRDVDDSRLLQDLDGHWLAREAVRRRLHFAEGAFAQGLPKSTRTYPKM